MEEEKKTTGALLNFQEEQSKIQSGLIQADPNSSSASALKKNPKPRNSSSLFIVPPSQYGVQEYQDDRASETVKLSVEERNRNRRFFLSVLDSESRQEEGLPQQLSLRGNESDNEQSSVLHEIEKVSAQPYKRMKQQLKERANQGSQPKEGKISLFSKLKQNQTLPSKKDGATPNAEQDMESSMFHKSFKFKQRKTLIMEMHEGEEENSRYEHFFRQVKNTALQSWFILLPDSNFRMVVDFISFFIILYISVQIPLVMSFLSESDIRSLNILDMTIDSWFMFELVLNFMTAYHDKGHLILNRKAIALEYLRSWFVLDLISSIPFSFIYLNNDGSPGVAQQTTKIFRIFKLVKYLRFLRILRFLKASKAMQSIEEQLISEGSNFVSNLLKLLFLTFFLSHWLACFFYGVGTYGTLNKGESWIISKGFVDDDIFKQYINALYWAITTMTTVGMGDISPTTSQERLSGILTVIFSSCLFGFVIQDIGKMISNYNLLASQFKERILYVEQFMRHKNFPSSLRVQIRRYLDYCMEQKSIEKIEEDDVMGLLNDDLRSKIQVHLYGGIFARIKLLNSFSVDVLSALTFILVKQAYTINEDLFVEGDAGSQIFYINTGKISIVHKETKTYIKDLKKKNYFGEVAFFTDLPRQATAKARDFSEVIILDRKAFIEIARSICPKSLTKLQNICERIDYEKRDFKALQLSCYLCEVVGHISIDCRQYESTIKGNILKYDNKIINKKATINDKFEIPPEQNSIFYGTAQGHYQESLHSHQTKVNKPMIQVEQMDIHEFPPILVQNLSKKKDSNQKESQDHQGKFSSKNSSSRQELEEEKCQQRLHLHSDQENAQLKPVTKQKWCIKKERGKKNIPKPSNLLTRKIGQMKRFESVEKRKNKKIREKSQDQQGRIIKIAESTKDQQQTSLPVNQVFQQQDNKDRLIPQVRNVFHPDYQDNNDNSERNTGIYSQISNNSPMHRLYQKLISGKPEKQLIDVSSPNSKLRLILKNSIKPQMEDNIQENQTSFQRILKKNHSQRDVQKTFQKSLPKKDTSLNDFSVQRRFRSNQLVSSKKEEVKKKKLKSQNEEFSREQFHGSKSSNKTDPRAAFFNEIESNMGEFRSEMKEMHLNVSDASPGQGNQEKLSFNSARVDAVNSQCLQAPLAPPKYLPSLKQSQVKSYQQLPGEFENVSKRKPYALQNGKTERNLLTRPIQ